MHKKFVSHNDFKRSHESRSPPFMSRLSEEWLLNAAMALRNILLFPVICFHAQQGVEKGFKALFYELCFVYCKGQNLGQPSNLLPP
jgi:hypothetical protein